MRRKIGLYGLTICGLTIVVIAAWFFLPQFFDKTVIEPRENIAGEPLQQMDVNTGEQSPEPRGTFTAVEGYTASGTATLITTTAGNFIRLENDFSVTNGPDLYVYVGDATKPLTEVAKLKGNKGSQNYQLPVGVDPTNFSTVWINCKACSAPYAYAILFR